MEADKMRDVLYAGVLGDALGVPVEFQPRGSYHISEMTGFGTWNQPKGTWSDDTSMTLCLIKNLTENGDYKSLMDKFVAYMERGEWTPAGDVFDIGNACSTAVRNYAVNKLNPLECGEPSEYGNGNGAIMRLAPLILTLKNENNLQKRFDKYRNYTSITHRHPRAIVGSLIYLEILWNLQKGADIDDAILNAKLSVAQIGDEYPEYQHESAYYLRVFSSDFKGLPIEGVKSTGYVVDTLEAAVWLALNHNSYESAVLAAVNLGGDTDTIGSITGTIMAFKKQNVVLPNSWMSEIVNINFLEEIFAPFIDKYAH